MIRRGAILLLLGALTLTGCGSDRSSPEGAGKAFASAVSDGDYAKAGAMVCQNDITHDGSADSSVVERMAEEFEGIDEVKFRDVVAEEKGAALLSFEVVADGETYPAEWEFVLENGNYSNCDVV